MKEKKHCRAHKARRKFIAGAWLWRLSFLLPVALMLATPACGPSEQDVDRRIAEGVREELARVPTLTPITFPTPLPTATPGALATPRPTVTPQPRPTLIVILPSPTPIIFPPTATPIVLPPTPTPIVLPSAPTPQPILDFSKVYQESWPSVFMIQSSNGRGSGWLIERGLILTNEHVIEGSSRVTVRQASNPPFTATVLAFDSWRDVALLQFDPRRARLPRAATPLPLGRAQDQDIASPLLGLGYSSGEINLDGTVGLASANVGVLSQFTDFGGSKLGFNLVMDAPNDPGDSGGPVLDSNGAVVGMIRAVQVHNSSGQRVVGTFYAVHIDEIRDILPTLKRGKSR